VTRREWLEFTVVLAVVNVVILGTLLAVTRGWIWFSIFEIGARKQTDSSITPYLSEAARLFAIPVLAVGTAAVVGWWRRPPQPTSRSFPSMLVRLLAVFLVVEFVIAFLTRRQQGAGVNEYLGVMWAFGLLLALVHRAARTSRRAMQVGIAVYAAIALIVFVPPLRNAVERPKVVEAAAVPKLDIPALDPALIAYARGHLVYVSDLGTVSPTPTHEVWPSQANLIDVLAAGEPIDYFVTALIERRFDAVTPLSGLAGPYAAQSGRTSPEYIGALNALMRVGYAAGANGAPSPLLGRRPREMDLSWARQCFSAPHPTACVMDGAANMKPQLQK
jgi:hypothetical protein